MGQRKCRCPIWVNGRVRGERVRRSLKTINWEVALRLVREWESSGQERALGISVSEACERFYADCVARGLSDVSLRKYALLTKDLCRCFNNRTVGELAVDDLRAYRESWEIGPVTARKRLERLRTFFKFCQESGWITLNIALTLKAPEASINR